MATIVLIKLIRGLLTRVKVSYVLFILVIEDIYEISSGPNTLEYKQIILIKKKKNIFFIQTQFYKLTSQL